MATAMQQWFFAGRSGFRDVEECSGWGCTHRCENEWQPRNVGCVGVDCGVVTGYSTDDAGVGASLGLSWPFQEHIGEGR